MKLQAQPSDEAWYGINISCEIMDIGKCFGLWSAVCQGPFLLAQHSIAIRAGGIFTYGLSGNNRQVTKLQDKSIHNSTDAAD